MTEPSTELLVNPLEFEAGDAVWNLIALFYDSVSSQQHIAIVLIKRRLK